MRLFFYFCNMKKILFAIMLSITVFSCDDDTLTYESTGQILGLDLALCPCCGNWLIQIEGEENPYQFMELPQDSSIDLTTANFPIDVQLNWEPVTIGCTNYIIIEAIDLL